MFSVGVSDHVMIAHSFSDPYFGPAQKLHGATYGVEVELRVPELNEHHVVVDIGVLRTELRNVLSTIDYSNLDEHPAFPNRTSTTERVAEWIAKELAKKLVEKGTLRVLLRESPVAWATFEMTL